MKISHRWLEKFFDEKLPNAQKIADALTFHAFEVEGTEKVADDEVLDVKVTPNRGHDCLSHRGIAKELAAILDIKFSNDPLKDKPALSPLTDSITVSVESAESCPRYIAALIDGIRVSPSPKWLKARLEAIGQRSINNVVDATNFVMFNIGQPIHAFDARKLTAKEGRRYTIAVRGAKRDEKIATLDGKIYDLNESMLVIADDNSDLCLGIAGVKGGTSSGIDEKTSKIIIESANFDGVSIRNTAQALRLRTDASQRFEQVISPELAAHGIRSVVDMILKLAEGELVGFVDVYPKKQEFKAVSVSFREVKQLLGDSFTQKNITDAFTRLSFKYKQDAENFEVSPPFERLDITISQDLIEEVGRIVGYENVPAEPLPPFSQKPEINKNFYWSEKIRGFLTGRGFSEVYTTVFADEGDRAVLNKVGGSQPFLRRDLQAGMTLALQRNFVIRDFLGLDRICLFEIGTVFTSRDEYTYLCIGMKGKNALQDLQKIWTDLCIEFKAKDVTFSNKTENELSLFEVSLEALIQNLPTGEEYEQLHPPKAARYKVLSKYPFIVRDIALWTPEGTTSDDIRKVIHKETGNLLVREDLFDEFKKGGKVSYAFRLVFQSYDKTLLDTEVGKIMEKITSNLNSQKGWQVR